MEKGAAWAAGQHGQQEAWQAAGNWGKVRGRWAAALLSPRFPHERQASRRADKQAGRQAAAHPPTWSTLSRTVCLKSPDAYLACAREKKEA